MSMLSGAMAGNAMPLVGGRNAGELLEILVFFLWMGILYGFAVFLFLSGPVETRSQRLVFSRTW